MRINPVHKHWSYIVAEFEAAITKQDVVMTAAEKSGEGTIKDYESGKMRALTLGLANARSKKRESRMDFFKQPARNKHRAMISYLESLLRDIYPDTSRSLEFKAGMIDTLSNWAVEEKGKIKYGNAQRQAA